MKQPCSKKIRLMQITHDLDIGGLQQVVVNLCRYIDRNRFQVSVLCLRGHGEFVPEIEKMGIPVFFLPQKKETDYFIFLKVAQLLRREKIDVIHTHNTQPFVDGTLASFMSGVKKIVHTDHARAFPDKRRYMVAEWIMSHFAYKVVGVSDHTTANLREFEKISSEKLLTIQNGISKEKYSVCIDKAKKRKELGLLKEGVLIGIIARLSEEKGITYLLQAMPKISACIPGVALIVAGKGDFEMQLKEEACMLGINDKVYFMGPRSDVPELLKVLDLCVLPSLREGVPMVILEAMAAECPVLATHVGGIPSVITHGENGSLVAPKEPELIAKEAIRLLQDETTSGLYRKNGKRDYEMHYSAKLMTDKYEKIYLGV